MEIINKAISRRSLALLLVMAMIVGFAGTTFAAFSDIPAGHEYEDYANDLEAKGIIDGYEDGTFRLNENLRRGQAAKMIAIAAGLDFEGEEADFEDVPEGHEMSPYIAALVEVEAIKGFEDGTFKMHNNITRRQIAQIIVKAFGLTKGDKEVELSDLDALDETTRNYIEVLASNGIVSGYADGTFGPNDQVKRGQFTKIVSGAMEFAEEVAELEVASVSAINETGVELVITAPKADLIDANVEVKDNEGNVVDTEATDIAAGTTKVTFDFAEEYEDDQEGVWTVDGVQYNFDEIALVADIIAKANMGNGYSQVALNEALKEAGIVGVNADLIDDYATAITQAKDDLETYADVQDIIDEVNEKADVIDDHEVLVALAQAKEGDSELAFFNVLNNNFDDVNPLWAAAYYGAEEGITTLDLDEDDNDKLAEALSAEEVEEALEAVQDEIYVINVEQIDATAEEIDSKEQAKRTALLEEWVEDHTDGEEEVKKADLVKASQIKEAGLKVEEAADVVIEATTENSLYAALQDYQAAVDAHNALVEEDDELDGLEDFVLANKAYYFKASKVEGNTTPELIVSEGNKLAEDAAEAAKELADAIADAEEAMANYVAAGGKATDDVYEAVEDALDALEDEEEGALVALTEATEALEEATKELEAEAAAKAEADKFKVDYAVALDLEAETVEVADLPTLREAVEAFDDLSPEAKALLTTEGTALNNLYASVQGSFRVDVNLINGNYGMSEKLELLGNKYYTNLTADQKHDVAMLLISARPEDTGFESYVAVEDALNDAIAKLKTSITEINNAEDVEAMEEAIVKTGLISEEGSKLTLMADLVLTERPDAGYASFSEIMVVLGLM